MKAVIGLGNPGQDYDGTRHNVGFAVVEELARRWRVKLKSWRRIVQLSKVAHREVILAEPTTFMNASGECVGRLASFFKLEPSDTLVVVDEVQLPLGRLKFNASGSAGGHNGLKSVIQYLGTDFPRLRIGVGRGDRQWDLADHVLSRFRPDELEPIQRAVVRAADGVELFLESGIDKAMNRYNAKESAVEDLKSET